MHIKTYTMLITLFLSCTYSQAAEQRENNQKPTRRPLSPTLNNPTNVPPLSLGASTAPEIKHSRPRSLFTPSFHAPMQSNASRSVSAPPQLRRTSPILRDENLVPILTLTGLAQAPDTSLVRSVRRLPVANIDTNRTIFAIQNFISLAQTEEKNDDTDDSTNCDH